MGERATQEGAGKGAERPACRAPSPELNCPELRLERGAPSQQTFLGTAPPLVPVSGLRVGGGFWVVFSDLLLKVTRSGLTFPPHDSQSFFFFFFNLFLFFFLVSENEPLIALTLLSPTSLCGPGKLQLSGRVIYIRKSLGPCLEPHIRLQAREVGVDRSQAPSALTPGRIEFLKYPGLRDWFLSWALVQDLREGMV